MKTINDAPNVEQHLSDVLERITNGYAELLSVEVNNEYMENEYYVAEYSGAICMAKPGAVSTANSTHLDTLTDLTKFVEVPTIDKITQPSVYQIWLPGTAFTFTGKGYFLKTEAGWQVARNYYGPVLSTDVAPGAKPSEYFIFTQVNNEITLLRSDKPSVEIAPPTEDQLKAFTISHVEYLTDGLQKLTEFKITGEPKIDRLLEGGKDGYIDAEVMLTFVQPAISINGEDILPVPNVGDKVTEQFGRGDFAKGHYFEAGTSIPYEARIRFKKKATADLWTFSTMSSIAPVTVPLSSASSLRIVYAPTDNGLVVHEVYRS